ncbi:MAG: hypothetical protein DCF30_12515 [Hyphomicrobiales bacterium]|nr:MAG: hypothetical protein DCF30_12515 [Hyphomicrobiales bacterium]
MEAAPSAAAGLRAFPSPLLLLGGAVLVCAGLLTQPLILPLGAMYWDLVLYIDAANRIADGQVPLLDFLTPVGPLGYWLFAWLGELFPRAQPLLLAQWSLFVITAPAMALILWEADKRSRATAFGLLLPYLVFQILPINVEQYSFFPGTDGFGIYNRQISIVLYVLVCALVVLRDRRALMAVLVWCLLALLLIKITGFLAGGLVVAFALLAGRFDMRLSLTAAAIAGVVLLALEIGGGLVSAYVGSILALLEINSGGILERFFRAGSLHLDIVAAGGALIVVLAWLERRELAADVGHLVRERSPTALRSLLDRDIAWLAVTMAAGLFLETQNTGGQAFIFIWPVLLGIVKSWAGSGRRGAFAVLALVAATAIPPLETVLQRAGRAVLAQTGYIALPHTHLGPLGQVSQHPEVVGRAEKMQRIYADSIETFRSMAAQEILPGQTLYSELDFQLGWLMAIDAGIAAILAHEAKTGIRFETIMSLNFVNPFPALMGRTGVRHITIGADPFRAVPEPDGEALAAVAAADLVLLPQCPVTVANQRLHKVYAPALGGRREIALGACWKGFIKD